MLYKCVNYHLFVFSELDPIKNLYEKKFKGWPAMGMSTNFAVKSIEYCQNTWIDILNIPVNILWPNQIFQLVTKNQLGKCVFWKIITPSGRVGWIRDEPQFHLQPIVPMPLIKRLQAHKR